MTHPFKAIFLLASVFVTGCAVLIVEIVAIRILSPYYGNTIYTTSSVIGTILAALSLGYYLGGKAADKYPYEKLFYGIICASGFLVLGIQMASAALLPLLGLLFSITEGPFISAVFLFFIPAFCLGTLSPFAIKLVNETPETIGSKSGQVFFWSTLGSILGSIASGFILIPHVGISNIIIGTGCVLAVWGIVGLFITTRQKKFLPFMVITLFLGMGFAYASLPPKALGVLYEKDGVYEKIRITEGQWSDQNRTPTAVGEGRPTRFLFQDRSYSAAMYVNSPELVYDYTKYYALYQLIKPETTKALVIGGGAYSIPKALLRDSPQMHVDVAEIEPELYQLAKTYFNLSDNPRLTNYTEDGRQLLARNTKQYDTIVSDVYYSLFSIPPQFTTKEFFTLARSRLSENGVFIGNFAGYLDANNPSFIGSEMATFTKVFPNSYFFAVNSAVSQKPQNIIFLGINGQKTINVSSAAITKNPNPILKNLADKLIDLNTQNLKDQQQLTDNFAPVEYLVGKVIGHWN